LRKVDLRGDGGAHVVAADDADDALDVALLDLLHVLQLVRIETICGAVVRAAGQQGAARIEHAHRLGVQLGHRGRHQMHDAGDLPALQRAARVQLHQHRRARLLLLAEEAVLLRQSQMHARVLHRGQRADRAHQFAFERALPGHALLELRLAEARVVEPFEPRGGALGQTDLRQLQSRVVHLVGGNENRVATIRMLVRHVHLRQLLVAQVRIQDAIVASRFQDRAQ
jgi:hypothetical protein